MLLALGVLAMAGLSPQATALGQDKPYMALVGELVGAIENPRLVQEVCASRFPKRRAEFVDAYAAWRTRHGELLKAIEEQVGRANTRLEREGAPPGTSVVTTVGGILKRRFDTLDSGKARQLCDAYPQILKSKDDEMATSVPALLQRVAIAATQTNGAALGGRDANGD